MDVHPRSDAPLSQQPTSRHINSGEVTQSIKNDLLADNMKTLVVTILCV